MLAVARGQRPKRLLRVLCFPPCQRIASSIDRARPSCKKPHREARFAPRPVPTAAPYATRCRRRGSPDVRPPDRSPCCAKQVGVGMNGLIDQRGDLVRAGAQLLDVAGGAARADKQRFAVPHLGFVPAIAAGHRQRLRVQRCALHGGLVDLRRAVGLGEHRRAHAHVVGVRRRRLLGESGHAAALCVPSASSSPACARPPAQQVPPHSLTLRRRRSVPRPRARRWSFVCSRAGGQADGRG